jgi:phage/plasmid-associated DNA primase
VFELVNAWIRCRDIFGGIPFKSKECKDAAERYRIENDDVERFFDECFERSDSSISVSYDDIKSLWIDFSGRSHFDGMRWLVKEMLEKHAFLEKGNNGGVRVVKGMSKRTDVETKKPADALNTDPDISDYLDGYK